jgi:hypothetical protein
VVRRVPPRPAGGYPAAALWMKLAALYLVGFPGRLSGQAAPGGPRVPADPPSPAGEVLPGYRTFGGMKLAAPVFPWTPRTPLDRRGGYPAAALWMKLAALYLVGFPGRLSGQAAPGGPRVPADPPSPAGGVTRQPHLGGNETGGPRVPADPPSPAGGVTRQPHLGGNETGGPRRPLAAPVFPRGGVTRQPHLGGMKLAAPGGPPRPWARKGCKGGAEILPKSPRRRRAGSRGGRRGPRPACRGGTLGRSQAQRVYNTYSTRPRTAPGGPEGIITCIQRGPGRPWTAPLPHWGGSIRPQRAAGYRPRQLPGPRLGAKITPD